MPPTLYHLERAAPDGSAWLHPASRGILKLEVKEEPIIIRSIKVVQYCKSQGPYKLRLRGKDVADKAVFQTQADPKDSSRCIQEASNLAIELAVGLHQIEVHGPSVAYLGDSLVPASNYYLRVMSFATYVQNVMMMEDTEAPISVSYTLANQPVDDACPSLGSFLEEALNDKASHDATFVVDGTTFTAHRFILMRVPYFRRMFTGHFLESTTNAPIALKFDDVTPSAFGAVLAYLYTDNVDLALSSAEEPLDLRSTLVAANAIDIQPLARLCEDKLMLETQTIAACLENLRFSSIHQCQRWKRQILDFVAEFFAEVGDTQSYFDLESIDPELFAEVVSRCKCKSRAKVAGNGGGREVKRRRTFLPAFLQDFGYANYMSMTR